MKARHGKRARWASLLALAVLFPAGRSRGDEEAVTCPKADDLLLGVTVRCGDEDVVGTAARTDLKLCDADGAKDCITSAGFPAVSLDEIDAANVHVETSVGGVQGTYQNVIQGEEVTLCAADGQYACLVESPRAALGVNAFAGKLLAGEIVAGISGTAVTGSLPICGVRGATGCLAVDAFPAAEKSMIDQCLGDGP